MSKEPEENKSDEDAADGGHPEVAATASSEGRGTETPPRPLDFSELGTPISGTTLTTLDPEDAAAAANAHGSGIWKLPPAFSLNAAASGNRRSRAEISMTSSVYSVTSGLVTQGGEVTEDLEGLVVQMSPSEEEAKRSVHSETPVATVTGSSSEAMQALMSDLKQHLDKTLVELRDQSRRDFEKVLSVLQAESAKRTALEGRLHAQLLMQSETMVAMELKLLRLEAKVERREAAQRQRSRPAFRTIDEEFGTSRLPPPPRASTEPTNIAVISSGASLASGVTAEDFREDSDKDAGDGDVEDEGDGGTTDDVNNDASIDDSDSTPTQSSRHPSFGGTLESILLNPMLGEVSQHGESTRATRGDTDGNSSLATSVTNATNSTFTSTVLTATTRGDSVRGRQIAVELDDPGTPAARGRRSIEEPRSRSNSPLTVQSSVVGGSQAEPPSVASNSVNMSILSTAAVAPARSFGSRRAAAAAAVSMNGDSRPLANRVVSFSTADILQNPPLAGAGNYSEAGDSITMPDELDNLSEVADSFASSARLWREEYEARLDALQKRWTE